MDALAGQQWFLRKHEDGHVFGPLPFEQLARWASSAQVAPHDVISSDQENWIKAPMLSELGMDWLVEVTSERYYGPTTLGAIQEFFRLGEINEQTFVINSCDGARRQLNEMPLAFEPEPAQIETSATPSAEIVSAEPAASGMAFDVQDRIRDLEQSLREERRALREAEERFRVLELKYRELTGNATAL
ncbi:MAG TPA: hypothetical protein VGI42_07165 [Chthoniobacterales bacterium]|jgi:hypothetical protein